MRLLIAALTLLAPSLAWAGACDTLTQKICPQGADVAQCGAFVDSKIIDANGKALAGVPRLTACKLVLDDAATLARFTDEMATRHMTRWFEFDVRTPSKKANGKAWDAFGGAPDIAACFVVDGKPPACVPNGRSGGSIRSPKCRDAFECTFRVKTQPGVLITAEFVDVDASDNDLIGRCIFQAGQPESVTCPDGPTLTLRP